VFPQSLFFAQIEAAVTPSTLKSLDVLSGGNATTDFTDVDVLDAGDASTEI